MNAHLLQNCLQWDWSNFVDPAEWSKIRLLNWDWGKFGRVFVGKAAKHRDHQIFFSPDPRNLLDPIFRDSPRSGDFPLMSQKDLC